MVLREIQRKHFLETYPPCHKSCVSNHRHILRFPQGDPSKLQVFMLLLLYIPDVQDSPTENTNPQTSDFYDKRRRVSAPSFRGSYNNHGDFKQTEEASLISHSQMRLTGRKLSIRLSHMNYHFSQIKKGQTLRTSYCSTYVPIMFMYSHIYIPFLQHKSVKPYIFK